MSLETFAAKDLTTKHEPLNPGLTWLGTGL